MEHFPVTRTDKGLHVEGFPDAVKIVRLASPGAKRLADLYLHRSDLEFADQCLGAINGVPNDARIIRQALWRSAIIHFIKCFDATSARSELSLDNIYEGEPSAVEAFNYFRNLRNKHLIHDENAYSQSLPAAVLNGGDKTYKIEKIVCLSVLSETLEQENFSNLKLLIAKARDWVIAEFVSLCNTLTKELEREPYPDLFSREDLIVRVPTVDEISKRKRG